MTLNPFVFSLKECIHISPSTPRGERLRESLRSSISNSFSGGISSPGSPGSPGFAPGASGYVDEDDVWGARLACLDCMLNLVAGLTLSDWQVGRRYVKHS